MKEYRRVPQSLLRRRLKIEEYDVLSLVVDGDLCGALREREGVTSR